MTKILMSLLIVALFSSSVILPTFGQQATETVLSERIYKDQYGPFINEASVSNTLPSSPLATNATNATDASNYVPGNWQSHSNNIASRPYLQSDLQPRSAEPQQLRQVTGNHQLGLLWGAVEPKKQAADSPWADVN